MIGSDFSLGIQGNNVLITNPGCFTPWDVRSVTGGSYTYDKTHQIFSPFSAKVVFAGSSAQTQLQWTSSFGTQTEHYGRIYLYMDAYPTVSNGYDSMLIFRDNLNNDAASIKFDLDGTLMISQGSFLVKNGIVPVPLSQWFRIEYHVIHDASSGFFEVKLFNNVNDTNPSDTIVWNNTPTRANGSICIVGCPNTGSTVFTYWQGPVHVAADHYLGPIISPSSSPHFSGSGRTGF